MDAFERVIAAILESEGYWVRPSFKVELTKEEKRRIGKPSMPRAEIDLVAYRGRTNSVFAIECKSYLDSGGVAMSAFDGSNAVFANRFKLFNDDNWRSIVEHRLVTQLQQSGMTADDSSVTWVLAAGNIASESHHRAVAAHFKEKGWTLWGPEWIATRLEQMSLGGYENDVVSVVTKLLERRRPAQRAKAAVREPNGSHEEHSGKRRPRPTVTYEFSRFCFKASEIERLAGDQEFRVVTPVGTFQMSKAEFERDFPNVRGTMSYRQKGLYHYPRVPTAARPYRIVEGARGLGLESQNRS